MTNQTFDAAFAQLLRAFNTHQDLRAANADIPALAKSSQELFNARMAIRHSTR